MDPILYFLSHSYALHLTLAIVSCLLGLGAGWWIWSRYQRECLALKGEVQQQKERLQKLDRERSDLSRTQDELQLGLKAAKADGERARTQHVATQEELNSTARQCKDLEARLLAAEEQRASADRSLEALRAELSEVRNELASTRAAGDQAKAHIQEQSASLSALRGEMETNQKQATKLIKERDEARKENTQLSQELKDKAEGLTQAQELIDTLTAARDTALGAIRELQSELQALQSAQANRSEQSKSENDDHERLQSQLTRLAAELSRSEDVAQQVQKELDKERLRSQENDQQLLRYEEEILRLKEKLASSGKSTAKANAEPTAPPAPASPQALLFDLPGPA